jgi:hypothetical protein
VYRKKNLAKAKEYAENYREEHQKELNEQQKARYAADKDKHAAFNRLHKHGITKEDYAIRLKDQQGKCAICGCLPKKLCVDHDHETGKIRGLLCNNCNLMLGHSKDSVERLRNAADYLDKNKEI